MRKSGFKGDPKFPPFEQECEKHFKTMLNSFGQIDWPARQDEIKSYMFRLKTLIKGKHFDKENAKEFLSNIDNFLFLYRSATKFPTNKKLAGEKELHHSAHRLKVEINKKPNKENNNGHKQMEVSCS